jgi:hypothetical protein
MFRTLTLVAALAGCAAILSAQAIDPDTFKVTYFSKANTAGAPDATVQVTNAGTNGQEDICPYFFVFDQNQEMSECCACEVSANGLATLSVNDNLTSNPLTGVTLHEGTIQIVTFSCTTGQTNPGVRAWATHIQNNGAITEDEFRDAGLSAKELTRLLNDCAAMVAVGSGHGFCYCPVETM